MNIKYPLVFDMSYHDNKRTKTGFVQIEPSLTIQVGHTYKLKNHIDFSQLTNAFKFIDEHCEFGYYDPEDNSKLIYLNSGAEIRLRSEDGQGTSLVPEINFSTYLNTADTSGKWVVDDAVMPDNVELFLTINRFLEEEELSEEEFNTFLTLIKPLFEYEVTKQITPGTYKFNPNNPSVDFLMGTTNGAMVFTNNPTSGLSPYPAFMCGMVFLEDGSQAESGSDVTFEISQEVIDRWYSTFNDNQFTKEMASVVYQKVAEV